MAKAWLSLGANIGDPPAQLEDALDQLDNHPQINIEARSSTLVNPPWGKTDQPLFHNLAVTIETDLEPEALLEACLFIEDALGRIRTLKWGPRLIDIDIIAYERLEQTSDTLTLPHKHAHERSFVISPLREIASDTANWLLNRASQNDSKSKP